MLQDLFFSDGLSRFGFVGGVGPSRPEQARTNYTGDPYVTDGRRAIFWLTPVAEARERRVVARWIPFRQRTAANGKRSGAELPPTPVSPASTATP